MPCAGCSAPFAASLRKCLCASCLRKRRVQRVGVLQPELWECTPPTAFVLTNLQLSSRSCGTVLRVQLSYLKFAIFQPKLRDRAPRTTFVPIFQPELPRTRRESNPRPPEFESTRANPQTTSKSPGPVRNRKKPRVFLPEFLHLDHANPRSGQIRNQKTSSFCTPRPCRSPQRVAIPIDDQSPAPAP